MSLRDNAFPIMLCCAVMSVGVRPAPVCSMYLWTLRVINGGAYVSSLTERAATPHFLPVMEMGK